MRILAPPFVLLLSLAACDKAEPAPKPAPKSEPAKAAEPAKPAEPEKPEPPPPIGAPTGLFACKTAPAAAAPAPEGALPFKLEACPSFPSVFGSVAWGMDQAAVAKAVKGVKFGSNSGRIKLGKQTGFIGLSEAGKVDELRFKVGPAGLEAMTAAWGPPLEVEFLGDKDKVWFNPAAKIKVEVEENSSPADESEKYSVRYQQYTPLTDLVAADGPLSKPIVGLTGEELAKNFPEMLKVKSAEQAKADVAALGLDAKTAGIASWAGADQASAELSLPRPETNNNLTISLKWDDKKVKSLRVPLSFGKDPAVKAEILAVVGAAFGAPTGGSKSSSDEWTYNFAGPAGTKAELRDTGESWWLELSK